MSSRSASFSAVVITTPSSHTAPTSVVIARSQAPAPAASRTIGRYFGLILGASWSMIRRVRRM
ncbi:hypothetical protein C7C45_07760 [Micromonospora arborensis]|uniref:Uncharacterized protein n=1 Tax=Micromonospora arborensis TaxID=2116518 RepID=A0A318NMC9_9ACTN|nr:hypothetical protein C7C45_07760 [Micromonospora arborensis]